MTLSCSGVVTPAPIEGSADKGSTRRAGIIGTSKGPFRGDYWEVSLAVRAKFIGVVAFARCVVMIDTND